ncbi:focadhesin [Cotesia glomerata]|uniref:DUF3730 domain-containing protein n=1 Tax=Cotesia glomerata TaxID=32391 RepID=A0AAV7HWA7_COTGL|nr:focadhesin [Cotesia glomerata]KAH0539537.1 hypothetical protein KQX54_005397 [Cotesia glomerata]
MDEIQYKLSSNNSILITHGISKILEIIKNKLSNNEDPLKIPELKSLFTKCKSENAIVSLVSCHAVVALAESGLIEVSETLSKLSAMLGETKNYSAVTSAICSLLTLILKFHSGSYECPFSIQAPQHPLITVLNEKADSWRSVLGDIKSMLHDCKPKAVRNHVELLRPVFIYIIANPTNSSLENCRQQAWSLLIRTPGALELQLEIIQWLRTINLSSCITTNNLILEFTELAVTKKNFKLFSALTPLIMALAFDLLKHNCDPRSNIVMIESILESTGTEDINHLNFMHESLISSVILSILSEMLVITPVIYLHDLIKIAALIVNKLGCNEIVAYSLLGSILPWMAYATPLSSEALEIADNLIITITTKTFTRNKYPENIYNDDLYNYLSHSSRYVQFYTNLCVHIESCVNLNTCLDKLSNIPKEFLYNYKLIIGGIFLSSKSTETILKAISLLVRVAKENNSYAGHVLSMLLYKLSKSKEIEVTKKLLYILPELAVSKENVPIIIQTLQTFLAADKPLKYVGVNLFLKAWMVEPRCHRYLMMGLIDMSSNDKSMEANITCAKAMVFICENRPEHGAELVPLLSQILNRCGDIDGSAASALALRGISALCDAGIADICSTWRVLAPKMNKEDRSIVIKSLCDFFATVPTNSAHPEDQFEELVDESLTKLWELTSFETTRNLEIIEAAFKALSAYTISQIKISVLPEVFLKDLPASKVNSEEVKTEMAFTYVPSTCWITMLETIHEPALSLAGNLIIKFITDELYGFKTGIYMWAMGEPINFKYLPEKSPVRAVGEYLRRFSIENLNTEKKKIMMECLRIFSYKYPKPLPPIKWELFTKAINVSPESWTAGITLACHQAAVSPSTKEFLSKYLTKMTKKCDNSDVTITSKEFKECWHLCTHLDDICRGVTSGVLAPFLDVTLNCIIEKAMVDDETAVDMFDQLMGFYSKTLKDDLVHFDNKTLIFGILEKLFDKIDVDSKIFEAYTKALLEMTAEKIERITLPNVWEEITNDKLRKAIIIRAGLVLKRDNEIPLSWMNEIIRVSSSEPGVQKCLLSNMKKIQSKLLTEKSNATWSWDLMCRIQATIVNSHDNYSLETTTSLCDILFVTIIVLACDDCFIENYESLITSHDIRIQLFPHAMATIILMPFWKDITQQIMEWLNFMRNSTLATSYKIVFHNTLVSLKEQRHLNDLWPKYLSVKSPIQL